MRWMPRSPMRHRPLEERIANLLAENGRLKEALQDIADATNPDDPESYRADDREGCLDTVQHIAVSALSEQEGK